MPTIDSGFPQHAVATAGGASISVSGLSTTGPSVLYALVHTSNPGSNQLSVTSAGGLQWCCVWWAGATGTAQQYVSIWRAVSASALTNVTLTWSFTSSACNMLDVYSISGDGGVGAISGQNSNTGAAVPQVTVNALASGSLILGCFDSYGTASAPTALANTTIDQSNQVTDTQTSCHATTSGTGNITVGLSAPSATNASSVAIEILPSTTPAAHDVQLDTTSAFPLFVVSRNQDGTFNSFTLSNINTAGNVLMVAMSCGNLNAFTGYPKPPPTVQGSGALDVPWVLVTNAVASVNGPNSEPPWKINSNVWAAYVAAPAVNATLTLTWSDNPQFDPNLFCVYAFLNANPSVGALASLMQNDSNHGGDNTYAPLTGVQRGSQAVACWMGGPINQLSGSNVPTSVSRLDISTTDDQTQGYAAAYRLRSPSAGGSVNVGNGTVTTLSNPQYAYAGVEVLQASGYEAEGATCGDGYGAIGPIKQAAKSFAQLDAFQQTVWSRVWAEQYVEGALLGDAVDRNARRYPVNLEPGFPVHFDANSTPTNRAFLGPIQFSTAGPSFLVIGAMWDTNQVVPSPFGPYGSDSVTGAGLTWTKVGERVSDLGGYLSVWSAYSPTALTNAQVQFNFGFTWNSATAGMLSLFSFVVGDDTTGALQVAALPSTGEATLTPTAWGSFLIGFDASNGGGSPQTPDANTTADRSFGSTGRFDTYHLTNNATTLTPITYGNSVAAGLFQTVIGVEILANPSALAEGVLAQDAEDVYGPFHLLGTAFQPDAFQEDAWQILGGITGAGPLTAAYLDGALIFDQYSGALIIPTAEAEGPTTAEVYAAFQRSVDGYLEGDAATDLYTGQRVIPEAYSDGALAGPDLYAAFQIAVDGYVDGASAGDLYAAFQIAVDGYLDGALGGDQYTAALILTAAYLDGASAGDLYAATITFGLSLAEGALAVDLYAAFQIAVDGYTDGATAAEIDGAHQQGVDGYSESAVAGDAYTDALILATAYIDGAQAGPDLYDWSVPGGSVFYTEGPLAGTDVTALLIMLGAYVEGPAAGTDVTAGTTIPEQYSDGFTSAELHTLGLRSLDLYAEGALAQDAEDATQVIPTAYLDGTAAAEAISGGAARTHTLVEGATAAEAYALGYNAGALYSDGAAAFDAYVAFQRAGAKLIEGITLSEAETATSAQSSPPSRGLYAPTSTPTWVPSLMKSIGSVAQQAVVAACGGQDLVLESPSALDRGAPYHPRTPDDGTRSVWQYEGNFYAAALFYGLRILPGAVYLAVTSGLVRARLVNPGPVTWFALPDLTQATVVPLVTAMNLLTKNPPAGPLPTGRAAWRDPAAKYVPANQQPFFAQPSAYTPTLMGSLDRAAQKAVVQATGGPAAVLTTPAALLGGMPYDPWGGTGMSFWQFEGAFYEAVRKASLRLKPGALYLGLTSKTVRARLVEPGPVAWLALPDLKPATVGPVVTACNALVP